MLGVVFKGHISWWYRFCQGWPKVSLRKGDPFSQAQVEMTNKEVFADYLALLKTLEKHDLMDKPSQI